MGIRSLITDQIIRGNPDLTTKKYSVIALNNATGVCYITNGSPQFISGHLRFRGRMDGSTRPVTQIWIPDQPDSYWEQEQRKLERGLSHPEIASSCFAEDVSRLTKPELKSKSKSKSHPEQNSSSTDRQTKSTLLPAQKKRR